VRTAARFPAVPPDRGHYESFYLKAATPERALWIRHTFHRRPGAQATGAVWVTWFDRDLPRPVALKQQFGEGSVSVPAGAYVRVGDAELAPGYARGELTVDGRRASWDLRFCDLAPALHHLRGWMYRSPLPRTKLLSPHPSATFGGTFELDGETHAIADSPGMVGHNWGAEHAARWIWIHAGSLGGHGSGDYLDVGGGRIEVGGRLTPWVANGGLLLGGRFHRLGGLRLLAPSRIDAEPTSCRFRLRGRGISVSGTVAAPAERFVGWTYADPGGGEHHSLNSSIADLTVEIAAEGRRDRIGGVATYEHGTAPRDHGIPIEPYPDG
jgi:hypothetical protein